MELGGGWQSRSDRRQIGTLEDAILEDLEKVLLLQRCREVANLEKIPPTLHLSCLLSRRMMQQRVQLTESNCELRLRFLLTVLFAALADSQIHTANSIRLPSVPSFSFGRLKEHLRSNWM